MEISNVNFLPVKGTAVSVVSLVSSRNALSTQGGLERDVWRDQATAAKETTVDVYAFYFCLWVFKQ